MKTWRDPVDKPYYSCLTCPRFRSICGGRPTRDMTLQEWCEYISDVMYVFHLTNAYVSQEAEVSMRTMEKIKAINCDQDIMRGTARRIEQVVLGPVGEHNCHTHYSDDATSERIKQLEMQVDFLRKENEQKSKIIDKYLG